MKLYFLTRLKDYVDKYINYSKIEIILIKIMLGSKYLMQILFTKAELRIVV